MKKFLKKPRGKTITRTNKGTVDEYIICSLNMNSISVWASIW